MTNDDGFDAQGLRLLERLAARLTDDVWTIAPEYEQSGASRALTLTVPVRVRQRGERSYSVAGTPTDSVRIALLDLMRSAPPDLLISGINRGQNIGEDIALSGTVAAAIQAAMLGVRSIALSQALPGFGTDHVADWSPSTTYGADLVRSLLDSPSKLFNVNFPDCRHDQVAGIMVTRQGFNRTSCANIDRRTDPRGNSYYWMCFHEDLPCSEQGTDIAALQERYISVTPLLTDLTDHGTAATMRSITLCTVEPREMEV
ncbi:5'/3'-nucleotidase SurE [Sphingobium yanoikuyae]|uniref:5'/3'-nucleotidase SurE n=1 Tax=Sphingobium yanoikuyae TaxID=13690 RepID=UPI001F1E7637|nr:5'/3'-nucleotidase SurE [Sphingobium yanoikuyae]